MPSSDCCTCMPNTSVSAPWSVKSNSFDRRCMKVSRASWSVCTMNDEVVDVQAEDDHTVLGFEGFSYSEIAN